MQDKNHDIDYVTMPLIEITLGRESFLKQKRLMEIFHKDKPQSNPLAKTLALYPKSS